MPRGHYDRSAVKVRKAEGVEASAPVLETVTPAKADIQIELAVWASVQNSSNVADLEEYLERYPEGNFALIAERRVRQLIAAETFGGKPEDFQPEVRKKLTVNMPTIPMPVIGDEIPKYQLLAPFFAENNTMYPEGMEIEYMGPPNEHMYPLNSAGKVAKKQQEEYLDACWDVKCKLEGKPPIPRPRELADLIESSRNDLRATGVVATSDLPPTFAELANGKANNLDPRADRIGKVTEGTAFKGRPTNAPLLGRDGHRYQRAVDPANPHSVT